MASVRAEISVLVATRDRPALLADALRSLRAQSFRRWEACIVDSGQAAPAHAAVRRVADERCRLIRSRAALGECAARNLALRHATGRYVCYLDDDDLLPVDSLALRHDALQRQPTECAMVHGGYARSALDPAGARLLDAIPSRPACLTKPYYDQLVDRLGADRGAVYALLKRFNFIRGGTPLVRRAAMISVGGFDGDLLRYGDYDLWLKLASRYALHRIDEVVYTYRFHAGCHHRRLAASEEQRMALRVCKRHAIRESLQWARHDVAIRALWRRSPETAIGTGAPA